MRLITALALAACFAAHAQLLVDEASTRARLVNGKTSVSVAIDNRSGQPIAVRVHLEWLDPRNSVRSQGDIQQTVPRGKSTVEGGLPVKDKDDALFYRLHYWVAPDAPNLTAFRPVDGTLSFPIIAEHAFTLRAVGIGIHPRAGQPYEFRVFASHPITHAPISGVQVNIGKISALTDAAGAAVLRIEPDKDDWSESGAVTVEGRRGDVTAKTEAERPAAAQNAVRIDTDKPIYQPGQTAHIRILALGADGRVRAGVKFGIGVFDSGHTLVQTSEVTTSRFGVASVDWEIAANAEPDEYQIGVATEDDDDVARRMLDVRRYELPSFRVIASPEQPFYLLGQTPEVEVRGEYLFGKPVTGGKVKITEADGNKALREGVLDASGHFRASLRLDEGKDTFGTQRFEDRHYTAYVTDPTTNRTEERRFDVRMSRDPLHVYIVRWERFTLGSRLYVAVYTPDGKAAAAGIEVLDGDRVLGSGRTNRFGVVRIEVPPAERALLVRARSAAGTATEEVPLDRTAAPDVLLDMDHALYRAGEPIHCRIRSARDGVKGTLLAWTEDGRVLHSQAVELRNREAETVIPYRPDFPRNIIVAFVSPAGTQFESARSVLYPGAPDLRITAEPAQNTYEPGHRASLNFQASTGKGAAVETALGIAVVDQSVFERAKTDQAGRREWFDAGDSGDNARVGGLSLQDLLQLPPEKIDADYQLVAEAGLEAYIPPSPGATFSEEQSSAFAQAVSWGLARLKSRLDDEYSNSLRYPTDHDSLIAVGYDFEYARDPWGLPYRDRFFVDGSEAVLELSSAGPDKKFGTEDDMVAMTVRREWFLPFKAAIRGALDRLKDYPATPAEFSDLLDQAGIRFDHLRDIWGNPLRAVVRNGYGKRTIEIQSPGPDHKFGTPDDVTVASYEGTFFRAMQEKIEAALQAASEFPTDEAQLRAVLSAAKIDLDGLRDPWGHPYSTTFHTDAEFGDRYQSYIYEDYGQPAITRTDVIPTKFTLRVIEIRSDGEDGKRGTYDDFTVARFSRKVQEDNPPANPQPSGQKPPAILGGTGTITGVVYDKSGAVIPGAEVTLNNTYKTSTDQVGRYYFRGLPTGKYELRFYAPGLEIYAEGRIPVQLYHVTRVDVTLQVATTREQIEVVANGALAVPMNAMASVAATVASTPNYTPHVRDYFLETLLWKPELVTDASGKASLDFKLADNITTWHVAVIGSTEDGRIAEGSTEIRAFQPFFVDLDPPQVLTVSDEISLPVPIRNYTDKEQAVRVEVAAPPALTIIESPRQAVRIAASSSVNPVIGLQAAAANADARLRVTARGSGAADAIEKPVAIHPDGEPVSRSVNDLVAESRPLRLDIPADAIPRSLRAEVKLYPNLLASVLESSEVLLQMPTGCAEQTISSSYLNLMVLRTLRDSGLHEVRLEARARRNLLAGYERLLGFRTGDGGFAYWANQSADIAITAYAIGFLEEAMDMIEIDDDLVLKARAWLSRQDPKDAAVRGLALRAMANGGLLYEKAVVERLGELARTAAAMDDSYAIATFALAAMDAKKPELAEGAIDRLRKLAHDEQGLAWWHLVRNTPFYGWGRAGQIEATALAVTALTRWRKHAGGAPQLDGLIDRGSLFLLRSKDDSGIWLSTQATIRVFTALFGALAAPGASRSESLEVLVNGVSAARLDLPGGNSVEGPITLDVSKFLKPGAANEVALRTPAGHLAAQARFTAVWYEPWKGPRLSHELALHVNYSTAETSPNQPVRCDVTVSRPSFRGYGMMIVEVGLPPGAEVDRGTLDDAKVDSYEVAPDHVTFYVWPNANDTKFSFTFRPRYAIRAVSAPSVLYDYYNPDARAVLPPLALVVK